MAAACRPGALELAGEANSKYGCRWRLTHIPLKSAKTIDLRTLLVCAEFSWWMTTATRPIASECCSSCWGHPCKLSTTAQTRLKYFKLTFQMLYSWTSACRTWMDTRWHAGFDNNLNWKRSHSLP